MATLHRTARTQTTTITLLDLVAELSAAGGDDREVVAAVLDLLRTGRVRLIGQIRDEHLVADVDPLDRRAA